ncbi:uncharacterized protein L969DRAFT_96121 [Mixia osmundae IAM 14324]|uniref:Chromatin assembly factor 1 subunit A dimerization domain-containing protein n=1 Tax=Mixia osmundae (strain CBS 9802 / IAM 14324 / JCM 22182 / KY 12970) TaxID=764103 RepID=G7EA34_MIXOS|nr:uncharacterized protein L969DRAFT_96121 [Mixia osmundae IAM 14324]KEI37593.1 hypothetical protein L969DRAFT_96121 [Mixia osmundae IAM 14324]GAA99694.1 hypothetical protein E5Q_06397 [Mixia osmundae IAM 14324]
MASDGSDVIMLDPPVTSISSPKVTQERGQVSPLRDRMVNGASSPVSSARLSNATPGSSKSHMIELDLEGEMQATPISHRRDVSQGSNGSSTTAPSLRRQALNGSNADSHAVSASLYSSTSSAHSTPSTTVGSFATIPSAGKQGHANGQPDQQIIEISSQDDDGPHLSRERTSPSMSSPSRSSGRASLASLLNASDVPAPTLRPFSALMANNLADVERAQASVRAALGTAQPEMGLGIPPISMASRFTEINPSLDTRQRSAEPAVASTSGTTASVEQAAIEVDDDEEDDDDEGDDDSGLSSVADSDDEQAKANKLQRKLEASAEERKAAKKAARKPRKKKPAVVLSDHVEIKGKKLTLKQKTLTVDRTREVIRAQMDIQDDLEKSSEPLQTFPEKHLPLLAALVQESEKTLDSLAKHIKDIIQPASIEEESQHTAQAHDKVPLQLIKRTIDLNAKRVNYGLTESLLTLRASNMDAVTKPSIPPSLALYRWEVNDSDLWPAGFRTSFERRREERQKAHTDVLQLIGTAPGLDRKTLLGNYRLEYDEPTKALEAIPYKPKKAAGDKAAKSATAAPKPENQKKPAAINGKAAAKPASKASTAKASRKPSTSKEPSASEVGNLKLDDSSASAIKPDPDSVFGPARSDEPVEPATPADPNAKPKRKKVETIEQRERREASEAKKLAAAEKKAAALESKAKREAAKRAKELEADKETKRKAKQAEMLNRFAQIRTSPQAPRSSSAGVSVQTGSTDFERTFRTFKIKSDVSLANINNFRAPGRGPADLVQKPDLTREEALYDFTKDIPEFRKLNRNPRPMPSITVREIIQTLTEGDLSGTDGGSKWYAMLNNRVMIPKKLLVFHEDLRPGYHGSWTKGSRIIRPRNPFAVDPELLNYEYDSELDWEEEDVGDVEDVGSDNNLSDDDGESVISGDFLASDDEIEMMEGFEDDLETAIERLNDGGKANRDAEQAGEERAVQKKTQIIKSKKRKLTGPLVPVIFGPIFETELGESPLPVFRQHAVHFLNYNKPGFDPLRYPTIPAYFNATAQSNHKRSDSKAAENDDAGQAVKKSKKTKFVFPQALLDDFAAACKASSKTNKPSLIAELVTTFKARDSAITKVSIEALAKDNVKRRMRKSSSDESIWEVSFTNSFSDDTLPQGGRKQTPPTSSIASGSSTPEVISTPVSSNPALPNGIRRPVQLPKKRKDKVGLQKEIKKPAPKKEPAQSMLPFLGSSSHARLLAANTPGALQPPPRASSPAESITEDSVDAALDGDQMIIDEPIRESSIRSVSSAEDAPALAAIATTDAGDTGMLTDVAMMT